MVKCGGVCHVFKDRCQAHEYEDCFVVTDPRGRCIGESTTMIGAKNIVELWEHDQETSKRKAKAKSKKGDGVLKNATAKQEKVLQDGAATVPKNVDQDLLKALWGSRKVTRLNKIRNTQYFGPLTVRELATLVLLEKGDFPKGLDTPISTGDVEGNGSQHNFSLMTGGKNSDHICLSYEMHEMEVF